MDPPSVDNRGDRSASGLATEALETQLEMFIENLRQINIMVSDFQPQAQTVLNQKFQKIVTDLREIEKMKKDVEDVQIPLEVCDYVDDGQNPQLYTKHCMFTTVQKNEEVKGKIEAYRKFKAHLLVETNKFFPEEIERYRAIRTEEDEDEEEDDDEDDHEDDDEDDEVDVEADVDVKMETDVEVKMEPDVEPEVEPSVVETEEQVDIEPVVEPEVEGDMEPDEYTIIEELEEEVDVELETEEETIKENGDNHE